MICQAPFCSMCGYISNWTTKSKQKVEEKSNGDPVKQAKIFGYHNRIGIVLGVWNFKKLQNKRGHLYSTCRYTSGHLILLFFYLYV